jgi:hypothetical protein
MEVWGLTYINAIESPPTGSQVLPTRLKGAGEWDRRRASHMRPGINIEPSVLSACLFHVEATASRQFVKLT